MWVVHIHHHKTIWYLGMKMVGIKEKLRLSGLGNAIGWNNR